jgi:hypothetical protein
MEPEPVTCHRCGGLFDPELTVLDGGAVTLTENAWALPTCWYCKSDASAGDAPAARSAEASL